MHQFLDIFLTVFHSLFVLFVLLGWAFPKLRKWHILALGLTAAAWLLLGFWYGIGYCPLTDWHWDIKRALGERHLPYSFVKYMADRITGLDIDAELVDWVTALGLVFGVVMAFIVNKGWRIFSPAYKKIRKAFAFLKNSLPS